LTGTTTPHDPATGQKSGRLWGSTGAREEQAVRLGRIGFWYRLAVVVLKPVLLALTRRRWSGFENVPEQGGVIIAVNHISHADPLVFADALVFSTGRVPRFLAKSTLFQGKGPLLRFVARVLKGTKQIPVQRYTADASLALADACRALESGEMVAIYPEGTVTRDPGKWPMQAKTGVARLALLSGAPVVPVAQWGAQEILDSYRTPGLHLLPRHTMTVVAGPPVDLSRWQDRDPTHQVLHEVTEAIMAGITRLLEGIRGENAPDEVFHFEPARRSA
jgi:1-acyl-sn-glycerol-3-phosphate acyltransferase